MTKNLILLIIISGFIFALKAQNPTIAWQKTIGGDARDELWSTIQTSDGNIVLAGSSSSSNTGNNTVNNNGSDDFWLVKMDLAGNILWQKSIGGNASDDLRSIKQTFDGGFILGGNSRSDISGDKTEGNKGEDDYWVVKTDSLGNIQWQKTIGGNDQDFFRDIIQTGDGGYFLGGYSKSPTSGDKTENSKGEQDYWVIRLSSTGNIQWQKTIGGDARDELNSVFETNDGGFILGGTSFSEISGNKTAASKGYSDYWVVKLSSLGSIEWQKAIGGQYYDELHSIQQTSDNGYILGGYSGSDISGDKTENFVGSFDYWIVKLNSSGNVVWQNTIGGSDLDYLFSINATSDGGYILGGYSKSPNSGDKEENLNGLYDYWVVKVDELGKMEWQKSIGGTAFDYFTSVIQTSDKNYIISGHSKSSISGDKTENSYGSFDYWVLKLDYIDNTNTSIQKYNADILLLYPNPVQNSLNIDFDKNNLFKIEIYNELGNKVIVSQKEIVDVSYLSPGIYFIKAFDNNKKVLQVQKFIKK